jgi:hypothetical protein
MRTGDPVRLVRCNAVGGQYIERLKRKAATQPPLRKSSSLVSGPD